MQIIPANPGFFVIHEEENGELTVGDPIIGWLIKVTQTEPPGEGRKKQIAITNGITADGDAERACNFFGYLNPDGSVTCPCIASFASIGEARGYATKERGRKS